ncbi:hypothetical protein FHG87_004287 [Trinorchestia longiramus]|nr:hypothetical protein FHG87_004287 [Trinorchestia longiramus]
MLRLNLLFSIFLYGATQNVVSTPVLRALPVQESGSFGPSLLADAVYVPFDGLGPAFSLAMDKYDFLFLDYDQCKANASMRGAQVWTHNETDDNCFLASLVHPVCSSYQGTSGSGFILQDHLSDGSPCDYAVLDPLRISDLLHGMPQRSFRVESPTILQIGGSTMSMGYPWTISEQENKIVIFPNDGSVVSTNDKILVDPACFTKSSCGVPFMTSSVATASLPSYVLHDVCGKVINIRKGPGINIFSHAGIGCKFFPDTYPASNCFVIVRGSGILKIDVTLVNFRLRTCDGFKLRVLTFSNNGTKSADHVCKENGPIEYIASGGRTRINLVDSGTTQSWQKYGFIINIMNIVDTDLSRGLSNV